MQAPAPQTPPAPAPQPTVSWRQQALQVLCLADPAAKVAATHALFAAAQAQPAGLPDRFDTTTALHPDPASPLPGRPPKPELLAPMQVHHRSPFTPEGLAALVHAVCHIEFNAINLALDAIWRFPALPAAYYRDWLRVAAEESLHFTLLAQHLATLGHAYGDFDAHDGLWAMTEKTAGDLTARMALVPRTLEARGLDATPPLQKRLAQAGDARAVEILDVILRDEIGHVAIGNRWYRWLCERDGLDAVAHYRWLTERYQAPRLRPPFNTAARLAAGFTEEELAALPQA